MINSHQAEKALRDGVGSLEFENHRYSLDPIPTKAEFQKHCHLLVGIRHLALALGEEEEKLAQKVQMYLDWRASAVNKESVIRG